ncbi:ATP-binding protein [Streptomyces sp. SP18CS02]|uniref:ATP-binding protein n=1 Tax=Streptomyces sp. SP18CS02 TaxID=3002531 RepID=UPI002E763F2C|nr:ATP-binding protein [Streptomyces sp. SP18CS02]MEE1757432.1 AAA family ATPase [Streptomyces sp. SP18CS02]
MSTGPSDLREVFAARLRRELHGAEEHTPAVSDARRAYREAACLLTRFDPQTLRLPGEARPNGNAVLELLDDCTSGGVEGAALWSLKTDVREAALRGLADPQAARRALECNVDQLPDEPGPEQSCLAYLSGKARPARAQSADELADSLQAVLWLTHVPGMTGLPDLEELQHTLERARLLEPLERLVQESFTGRTRELGELRSLLGLPAGTAAGLRAEHTVDPGGRRSPGAPLIIYGPGGMGKSTLLAKFILDSAQHSTPGFPFAYIDFERPTLSVHEPITLIVEVARQLGVQYPSHRAEFDALGDEGQQAAGSQREGQERVTQLHRLATTRAVLGRSSSQEFQRAATERETGLIRRIADVLVRALAGAGQQDPPFLLALDSFEAAQYRGSPVLGRIWAIINTWQAIYPPMRLVVSGRAPVGHPSQTMAPLGMELRDLDPEAAVGLLEACGVTDHGVARALADRVGGHPLSLKLAARAAALAGGDTDRMGDLISSLPARRRHFFHRVDQMLVQGILYDRILNHIAHEEVRRLAHPGLVLRVITPEIIKDVLAEPCGLRVETMDDARTLFHELSRLDLVEPAGAEALRHRPDVRAIMLRLTGTDRNALTRDVEQRAIAYYAAREGVEARAEEIYHRLRLDENPRAVEERWLPGVELFLTGAQEDMGPRAAGLLTAKLGLGAQDRVMAGADQEDWERIAAQVVEDLLAQGHTQNAVIKLGERRPWTPCSPLHALLAETLNRLGRPDQARETVSKALSGVEAAGCGERRLELLLLSARLAEEAGDRESADRDLRVAEDIAVGLGQELEAMGALLARTRLAAGGDGDDDADGRLAQRLRRLPDAVLADQPVLVRAVASQIYTMDSHALDHVLDLVGLPDDEEVPDILGSAIRRAVRGEPGLMPVLMPLLGDAAVPPRGGTAPSSITEILRLAREQGNLDQLARRLLSVRDGSGLIVAGVAAAMGLGSAGRARARSGARADSDGRGTP